MSETVEPITSKGTAVINPTNVAPNRICFSLMFPVVKNMVYLLNRTVITAIVYKDTNFLANFYNIILKIIPMLIIFKFSILFEKNFTHFETY